MNDLIGYFLVGGDKMVTSYRVQFFRVFFSTPPEKSLQRQFVYRAHITKLPRAFKRNRFIVFTFLYFT